MSDLGSGAATGPPASDHPPACALLIINPKSRMGAVAGPEVRAALEAAGLSVREMACAEARDLSGLIEACAGEIDRVVIGGGDGTLNAALPGLLRTGLPLGLIPLGTANDLARTLGIPTQLSLAAQVAAGVRTRRIDVGEVNGHPYFNVASIGFGVDLTRALTADSKKRWGVIGYAVAGLRVLRRTRAFSALIEQNGQVRRASTIHLAVGNGRHYGGGMTISEDAAIDDARLNVYSLEMRSLWRFLAVLPWIRSGTQGRWREVLTLSTADIVVRTHRPRAVNADGEIVTETPAHFRVRPAALDVFVP